MNTIFMELGLSIVIGFVIAFLILQVLGYSPLASLSVMMGYGYRDLPYLIRRASPLIASGLAFAIPMYSGLFNIGSEGQIYLGALTALLTSYFTGNPAVSALAGFSAGALLGAVIGILRVHRNVNEVVSSIMINWVLYYMILWSVTQLLQDPSIPYQSRPVPPAAQIGTLSAFIVALAVSILAYFLMFMSDLGYEMRVVGQSLSAARYAGIDPAKAVISSMIVGGGIAGLGGAIHVLSVVPYIDSTMTGLYGIGFTGIGAAMIGRNNPIGIVLSSMFITGLIIGGQFMELRTGAPPELSDIIIAIFIISLSIPYAYRSIYRRIRGVRYD